MTKVNKKRNFLKLVDLKKRLAKSKTKASTIEISTERSWFSDVMDKLDKQDR